MSGLLDLSSELYEQLKGNVETLQQALVSGIQESSLTEKLREQDFWIQSVKNAVKLIEDEHDLVANEDEEISSETEKILAMTAKYQQETKAFLQQTKEARANISQLISEKSSKQEEMAVLQRTLDLKKGANQQKIRQLSKAVSIFRNFMDIEVLKIKGGNLQFIYRDIDPSDPTRPCTFSIRLLPIGGFDVTDCQPPLSCMAELLDRLRETKNMSAFISRVRKAFQATF